MSGCNGWAGNKFRETPVIDESLRAALVLLRQPFMYAQDAGADLWDFALEINLLYEAGLTISDLRWLIAKGLVFHAQETSVYGDRHRSFRLSDGFNFETTTCLVFSPSGAALASRISNESDVFPQSTMYLGQACVSDGGKEAAQCDRSTAVESDGPQASMKPSWDPSRRELSLDALIVKRFRVPARNQESILGAFEEEGWPEHIDDPLIVVGEIDPRTRLHDAINRLNGNQTNLVLRFLGNGYGTGIAWEIR